MLENKTEQELDSTTDNRMVPQTVSIKSLNIFIILGMIAIVMVTVFLAKNGGFTITFETDGGSMIESQIVGYGELITEPIPPVKEGFIFDGWYWDVERTYRPCDFMVDTVDNHASMYAKWKEKMNE